jgi:Tfp pilus assembly PilM family ATPase
MPKILSIEIDNKHVKIIEATRKINGELLTLNNFLSLTIPSNCINDGKLINLDLIRVEIGKALIENQIKTKKTIFIISPDLVITRKIRLPLLKSKIQTTSMIKLEFEQLLCTNANQIIIYKNSDSSKKIIAGLTNDAKYVVYGLSYNTYNQYIELSKMLKLNLISLVTSANCLEKIQEKKLLINGNTCYSGTFAFVKILCDTTIFCVIKDGINDFSRVINLNSSKFKLYNADRVAEFYENNYSNSNTNQENSDIDVNLLIDEINKNIRYYCSMDKDSAIDKIYIYGDWETDNTNLIEKSLSVAISKGIENIDKISNLSLNSSGVDFDIVHYFHGFLSLFTSANDTNFLIHKIKKCKNRFSISVCIIAATILIVIIISSYSENHFILNKLLKGEIDTMNSFVRNEENRVLNNKIEKIKNEIALLEEYKEQSIKLKKIIDSKDSVPSEILREIEDIIPLNTKVTSIIVGKNNIQIQCESSSVDEIILFLSNLRYVNSITSVYVPLIKCGGANEDNYYYSTICKLGDVKQNED